MVFSPATARAHSWAIACILTCHPIPGVMRHGESRLYFDTLAAAGMYVGPIQACIPVVRMDSNPEHLSASMHLHTVAPYVRTEKPRAHR
jgi:hypothetical protein